ncbi:unnamed protein product, partial [Polarella glacialis]
PRTMPVDYSRFDHIGDSDSDGEATGAVPRAPVAEPQPAPPDEVMEDLEDYFQRLDARRAEAEEAEAEAGLGLGPGTGEAFEPPSVERFEEADLAALAPSASSARSSECSICLAWVEEGEQIIELPCAARHTFHAECAQSWLSRNVSCPLCRVDVRKLVRAKQTSQVGPSSTSGRSRSPSPQQTPRSVGFTRDGGVILRYEPRPPPELPRPPYIPRELHGVAELVEIDYPERGTARVWRVPRNT